MKILSLVLSTAFLLLCGGCAAGLKAVQNNNNGVIDNDDAWVLVFEDNFGKAGDTEKKTVNRTLWMPQHGWSPGSQEVSFWTDRLDNLYQSNGTLKITTLHAPYQYNNSIDGAGTAQYTGAAIVTAQPFTYGRFEGSIKLPAGDGTHPGFWLLANYTGNPTPWPICGEIDIMENVGFTPGVMYSTLHDGANNWERGNDIQGRKNYSDMYTGFVNYTAVWTPDSIDIYGNGKLVLHHENPGTCQEETWPWFTPFNLHVQMDIGGNWGGQHGIDNSIFPAEMEVDWIRIYQQKSAQKVKRCENYAKYVLLEENDSQFSLAAPGVYDALVLNGSSSTLEALNATHYDLLDLLKPAFDFQALNRSLVVQTVAPLPTLSSSSTFLLLNFTLVDTPPGSNPALDNILDTLSEKCFKKKNMTIQCFPRLLSFLKEKVYHDSDGSATTSSFMTSLTVSSNSDGKSPTAEDMRFPFHGGWPYKIFNVGGRREEEEGWIYIDTFDFGGQLVGSYDTTPWNMYGDFGRAGTSYADLSPGPGATANKSDELALGYVVAGEWVQWSGINVTVLSSSPSTAQKGETDEEGFFIFEFIYSNGMAGDGIVMMDIDGVDTGLSWSFPETPSWNQFDKTTSFSNQVKLSAGMHTLRLKFGPNTEYRLLSFNLIQVVV